MAEQTRDLGALLARYAEGPDWLEAAIEGLSEADLDVALSPGTWTIRQIVHHVVDGDDLWKTATKAALGNSRGLFSYCWYWERPQDDWSEDWAYAAREIEPSLALFRANRRHIVQLLEQVPDCWERLTLITVPDEEERQTRVAYVVEMQTNHVTAHIDDIRQIRQAHDL